jgi:hypothetical protein
VILRRILFFLAGATALSVSAGVIVVALAYALFALVKPALGPAGASAVVAGAAAVLIGLFGLVLSLLARPPKKKPGEPDSVVDAVIDFVRSKPVTAIAGAVTAGLLAVRNPKYLGAMIGAFFERHERTATRRGRRR